MIRDDAADLVFLTQKDKFDAIIEDIEDCQNRAAGTRRHDVDRNIGISVRAVAEEKDQHEVLNAKQHEREADIVHRPAARAP